MSSILLTDRSGRTYDPSVLAARIDRDANRPGLTAAGAVAEIPRVLAARMPLYKMTCHAEIETDGMSQERVAAPAPDREAKRIMPWELGVLASPICSGAPLTK
jgi:hypothetical protein